MFTTKRKSEAKPVPEQKPATPTAEALAKHRAQAPADVRAAYALVAEYERRCPVESGR